MGVVLGMTGSLLGGFYRMFETSEDQSAARMRAQDVFNILMTPIQNAGIGVPSRDMSIPFTFKFPSPYPSETVNFAMNNTSWGGPLGIAKPGETGKFRPNPSLSGYEDAAASGDQMRVIYGIPTGIKHVGGEIEAGEFVSLPLVGTEREIEGDFTNKIGAKNIPEAEVSGNKIDPYDMAYPDYDLIRSENGVTSTLVAFPGANMMPAALSKAPSGSQIYIVTQPLYYEVSPDYTGANIIRSYQDIFMLRAGWAYVNNNTFCMLDIYNFDKFQNVSMAAPSASADIFSGFMIEGIAGIWFETDSKQRYVTVEVLAEGDTLEESRGSAARAALESKWTLRNVTLAPGVYYEEFSRTYRTRNIQQ
jgi:hypothetical protein